MKKILIVDDEKNVLAILKSELDQKDVEIIVTSNFQEATWAVTNAFFDVAIVDVKLKDAEGGNGLDLTALVQDRSPDTKVIVITGYGSPEIEQKAYERGAYSYCEKPLDINVLRRKLVEAGIFPERVQG